MLRVLLLRQQIVLLLCTMMSMVMSTTGFLVVLSSRAETRNRNRAGPVKNCVLSSSLNTTTTITSRNDPSEETVDERRMRLFWQEQSFEVAQDLVRRVLRNDTTSIDHDIVHFSEQWPYQHSPHLDAYDSHSNRPSFGLCLAYDGSHFCGWQRQAPSPSLESSWSASSEGLKPSVQAVVEDAASRYFGLPSVDVRVSGRTDAGVHAIAQVARLRLHANVTADAVQTAMDAAAAAAAKLSDNNAVTWKCLSVQTVAPKFHPSFDTKKRSYVYLIDINDALKALCSHSEEHTVGTKEQLPDRDHRLVQVVERLDQSLQSLVGRDLDYLSFSYGKIKTESTLCHLHHARARLVASPAAVAIELTGNRFLRRMVRILVATALHHAICTSPVGDGFGNYCAETGSSYVTLVDLCRYRDRRRTSKAAPPGGLIFVGATL